MRREFSESLSAEYDAYDAGELVVGYKNFEYLQVYRVHNYTAPVKASENSLLSLADSSNKRHLINADEVIPLHKALNECGENRLLEKYLRDQIPSLNPLPLAQEMVKNSTIGLFAGGNNKDVMLSAQRFDTLLIAPAMDAYGCNPNEYHDGVDRGKLNYIAHQFSPGSPPVDPRR